MKLRFLVVLAACCLLGAEAPADKAAIGEVEKAVAELNKAFESGNAALIKQLTTSDHVAITPYYRGPRTIAEQIQTLADLKLDEYKTGKFKVKLLAKDVAMVSYQLTMKGTYKGKAVASSSFASSVWVRKSDRWVEAFYQETSVDDK